MRTLAARPVLCALLGAAVALTTSTGGASPAYPKILNRELDLNSDPRCGVCHLSENSHAELTAFCSALVDRGLRGDSEDSLSIALAQMQADEIDSDRDGARDLDELSWNGDPNSPELPGGAASAPPSYGCNITSQHPTSSNNPLALLGVAYWGFRRHVRRMHQRGAAQC